ncbi:hypothetical protein HD599_002002 [Conyzicola lurida]|uniref:Uncharacterized protein n=1 Tax=Conyzicola lurida TaxID=1172621 RepID=A0A841AQI2_9MICO|nr:hypothetical protein [Conyzicola lurida]MBB5843679.1 hypothetical protein [Conyzicola lurida]
MRRVYYSSGSVLTADSIAAAVLEYAEALAKNGRADIVAVPVVLASGHVGTATLLIGPTSQLASVTEESELPSPDDDQLVADLQDRSRRLGSPKPAAHQYAEYLTAHEDYE